MWHGRYISKGGCFVGVLRVSLGCFNVISWVFPERLNYIGVVLQRCFRIFCQKAYYFCAHKSRQLPIQTQLDRNTLRTPSAHPLCTPESHWNTLEIILKYPWNNHEIGLKHPKTAQEILRQMNIYIHVAMMVTLKKRCSFSVI